MTNAITIAANSHIKRINDIINNSTIRSYKINFCTCELIDDQLLQKLFDRFPKKVPPSGFLYIISATSTNNNVYQQIRQAFRDNNTTLNLSRDNKAHPDSNCLYVGTSDSLSERFRSHLGHGEGTTTWGFYLRHWINEIVTDLCVEYYEFDDLSKSDICLLEDITWDHYKPMFGKKGGK